MICIRINEKVQQDRFHCNWTYTFGRECQQVVQESHWRLESPLPWRAWGSSSKEVWLQQFQRFWQDHPEYNLQYMLRLSWALWMQGCSCRTLSNLRRTSRSCSSPFLGLRFHFLSFLSSRLTWTGSDLEHNERGIWLSSCCRNMRDSPSME